MLRSTRRIMRAAGSIMNLFPATDYTEMIVHQSDVEAILADFQAVGDDLRISMRSNEKQQARKTRHQFATASR